MICPLVTFRVQVEVGFRSTRHSTMLIIFGSVPSSGRPALEITLFTSGIFRRSFRMRADWAEVSLTETPGGSVTLIQIDPSFNSGRNSVPRRGRAHAL